jgi:hypothetical protein
VGAKTGAVSRVRIRSPRIRHQREEPPCCLSSARRLPSHTTVAAYLSLFLVLSGGTAVALAGSNTVFTDDIAPGEIKNSDLGFRAVSLEKIGGDAINSGRVVNNSLTGTDIAEPSLATVPNADELDGKDAGELGINGYQTFSAARDIAASSFFNIHVPCPEPKRALGGGYSINRDLTVRTAGVTSSAGIGFDFWGVNDTDQEVHAVVTVVCADMQTRAHGRRVAGDHRLGRRGAVQPVPRRR